MRGLILSVLRNAEIGDCSNGGISARHVAVTLIGPGVPEIFEPSDDRPAVRLVKREIGGDLVIHAEPVTLDSRPAVWWMASGAFVSTCDSRFGDLLRSLGHSPYAAIPLHDRREW